MFGFGDTVLSWFQSYLENQTQAVAVHGKHSTPAPFRYGVPQGSVLRPMLFILYLQPLSNVIKHPVLHRVYANDIQIYRSCTPSEIADTIKCIEQCISNIKTWMFHNKLQMNNDNTEAILFAWKGFESEHLPKLILISDAILPLCLWYETWRLHWTLLFHLINKLWTPVSLHFMNWDKLVQLINTWP